MKTIIFDMDGTLADSFELAIEITFKLINRPKMSEQEISRLRRLPVLKVARELDIPLRRLPRLILRARQVMHDRMQEVHTFAGIAHVLAELKKQDCHLLVMSSNSEQNIRIFLRSNSLEQYFDGVYGGIGLLDKTRALKKIIRINNVSRSACYYIGDEVRDVVAAKKSGIRVVAVAWGYQDPQALAKRHPDALAQRPYDLLDILRTGSWV